MSLMQKRPEFQLLISLTHPSFKPEQSYVQQAIANPHFDWQRFVSLVEWHRVTPLVVLRMQNYHGFIPDWIVHSIQKSAQQCLRRALQQSAWLIKIARLLNAHDIRFITIKGVAIAKLLYDDFTRRQAKDLDILIDKSDLPMVEQLLVQDCGFKCIFPVENACASEIRYYDKFIKDRVYIHCQDKTIIELHWRFFNEQSILAVPFTELIERSKTVTFHQQAIAILGREDLWLYQTMHGCHAGWYRLHWVTDLADMLVKIEVDWDELINRSNSFSCKQNLLIGIILAAQVYRLPVPDVIRREFNQSWRLRISVILAKRLLINSRQPTPIDVIFKLMLWWSWQEFLYQLLNKVVQSNLTSGYARSHGFVKRSLYFLFRPVSLIIRYVLIRFVN